MSVTPKVRGAGPRCANGDGRKAFRAGLCRACYDQVPHEERTGGKIRLPVVDVGPEVAEGIAAAALREGITAAKWRRRAYEEQLRREGQLS